MAPKAKLAKRPAARLQVKKIRKPTPLSDDKLAVKLPAGLLLAEDPRAAELVPKLTSASVQTRKKAAQSMIALGSTAIPSLQRVLLLGTSNNLRGWAAGVIRKLTTASSDSVSAATVTALTKSLQDSPKCNGEASARALVAIGVPLAADALPALKKFAKEHPQFKDLGNMIRSMQSKSTVLKRPAVAVKPRVIAKATALGLKPSRPVDRADLADVVADLMLDGSRGGDENSTSSACKKKKKMPPFRLEDPTATRLADKLNDTNAQVRKHAGAQLVHLGGTAVPTLRRVLQESPNANTRSWACGALEKIAGKSKGAADSAVPNLISALTDVKSIAVPAAEALLAIGAPVTNESDAVPRIKNMLSKYSDVSTRLRPKLDTLVASASPA